MAEGACRADALADRRGQRIASLAGAGLVGELRVLRPDQLPSGPADPQRLNVQLDEDARIMRLFCG